MEVLSGMVLFSVCTASLTPEATFWYDRPTYWWKSNYTAADECSSVTYCSIEEKPKFYSSYFMKTNSGYSMISSSNISLPDITAPRKRLPAPPVNVTFYYEPLCSGCKDIFTRQIFPTFTTLDSTNILNLQLVPFGDTQEFTYGGKFVLSCEPDSEKCLGKKIESCAIKYSPADALVPLIYCLEYYGPTMVNAQLCTSIYDMPWKPIYNCFTGNEGDELVRKMAEKTKALNPSHPYLPLFTLNGRHSDDIQEQLSTGMLASVCDHYTGVKPVAC